jgi:hypothetical protein
MDLRQYDPAIGRWISIDPVIHFSNSTYNGFDNNPIFWADPSGADVVNYEYKYGTPIRGGGLSEAASNFIFGGSGWGVFLGIWL